MNKVFMILMLFALPACLIGEEPIVIEIDGDAGGPAANFASDPKNAEVFTAETEEYFGVSTISMPEVKKSPSKKITEEKEDEESYSDKHIPPPASAVKAAPFFYKRTCFYGSGIVFDERPIISLPQQWPFKGSYVYLFEAGKEGYLKYRNFKCPDGTMTISSYQKTPTVYGRGGNIRYGAGCIIDNNSNINADKDHSGIYCSGSVKK